MDDGAGGVIRRDVSELARKVGFVHLHLHTSFSLREGALTIANLIKFAKADDQPALAITDTNNLFGALEFSEKVSKEGIQPIIGCQLTIDFGDGKKLGARADDPAAGRGSVVLIAQTEEGYSNLMRLASRAWLESDPGDTPHVNLSRLENDAAGIVALTGGPSGVLNQLLIDGRGDHAKERLAKLTAIFPDRLYVELQRHGLTSEKQAERELLELAYRRSLPIVATNEPYFAARSDYEAHDALLCISDGAVVSDNERRQLTAEHRFKTRAEMGKLFADLPEALERSVEIAMRCSYRPKTREPILPRFTSLDGAPLDEEAELRRQAQEGLAARLAVHGCAPGLTEDEYRQRLDFELGIIVKMKFPGYFLIVSDFIKYAKSNGIPVGPGRGSGAGSLVA